MNQQEFLKQLQQGARILAPEEREAMEKAQMINLKAQMINLVADIYKATIQAQAETIFHTLLVQQKEWRDRQAGDEEHWPKPGEEGGPPTEIPYQPGVALNMAISYAQVFVNWVNSL